MPANIVLHGILQWSVRRRHNNQSNLQVGCRTTSWDSPLAAPPHAMLCAFGSRLLTTEHGQLLSACVAARAAKVCASALWKSELLLVSWSFGVGVGLSQDVFCRILACSWSEETGTTWAVRSWALNSFSGASQRPQQLENHPVVQCHHFFPVPLFHFQSATTSACQCHCASKMKVLFLEEPLQKAKRPAVFCFMLDCQASMTLTRSCQGGARFPPWAKQD